MRKIIVSTLFVAIGLVLAAQIPEDAFRQLERKRYDKAKEIIDKLTADPKTANGDAWYVRSQVYEAIAADSTALKLYPNANDESFAAFKKTVEIDPKNKFMLLNQYKTGFLAYQHFANAGAIAFNQDNLEKALENYKKALEVSSFLHKNDLSFMGLSMPAIDTSLIFMAGYCAFRLKKNDETASLFKILVDSNITNQADYVIAYQFMSHYYKEKDDAENFKKYTAIGRAAYPKDRFFITIQMDYARSKENQTELFKGYDDLLMLEPDSLNIHYFYASEAFNYVFKDDDKLPENSEAFITNIISSLKKCIDNKYETFGANYLLGQVYFNHAVFILTEAEKFKGPKPEDVKARADIRAKASARFAEAIPYFEFAATDLENRGTLKITEKSLLRNAYGMLEDCYNQKGDKVKAGEYNKKYANLK